MQPSALPRRARMTVNSLRFNTAGAYTVNTAGNLVIATGGILETSNVGANAATINNNTLTSGNGQDLIVHQSNTSAAMTISSQITNNGSTSIGLTKSGAGTLTLTGTNSYSGTTTINAGTLQIGAYGSLGTGNVVNSAALVFANGMSQTNVNGAISGSGSISLAYDNLVYFTGANTFTGPVTVENGSGSVGSLLVLCNNSALGSTSGVTVNNNGGLALTSGITIAGASLVLNGAGAAGIGSPGALQNLSGSSTWAGPVTLQTNSSVDADSSLTVSGAIGGGGQLTKTGTGTLRLTGANTYVGGTTVTGGTLELGESAQSPVLSGGGCDIQGGQIVFDYTGPGDDPALTIKSLLTASYDASGSHRFDVGQFKSTTADATHGLGWIDNTTTHQVTVGYTLYGDANLDGAVNVQDLAVLAANYRKSVNGWASGDFNNDGVVDVEDLALLVANYRHSLASDDVPAYDGLDAAAMRALSLAGLTVVPEPGAPVLLVTGLISLLAYVWRKRK